MLFNFTIWSSFLSRINIFFCNNKRCSALFFSIFSLISIYFRSSRILNFSIICYLDNWGKLSTISPIVKDIRTLFTTYILSFALLKLMPHITKLAYHVNMLSSQSHNALHYFLCTYRKRKKEYHNFLPLIKLFLFG